MYLRAREFTFLMCLLKRRKHSSWTNDLPDLPLGLSLTFTQALTHHWLHKQSSPGGQDWVFILSATPPPPRSFGVIYLAQPKIWKAWSLPGGCSFLVPIIALCGLYTPVVSWLQDPTFLNCYIIKFSTNFPNSIMPLDSCQKILKYWDFYSEEMAVWNVTSSRDNLT